MRHRKGKQIPFAKIVVGMAVGFLVGLGLCGVSIAVSSAGYASGEEFGGDKFGIATVSLVVMMLSAAGLVASLLLWAVAAMLRGVEGGSTKPEDDTKHDV